MFGEVELMPLVVQGEVPHMHIEKDSAKSKYKEMSHESISGSRNKVRVST